MVTIQVTAKALNTQIAKPTFSEFATTSDTFVDIPDATGFTSVDKNFIVGAITVKITSGPSVFSRVIDTVENFAVGFPSTFSTGFQRKNTAGAVKNTSGVTLNMKGQLREGGGATATVQANSLVVASAPFHNGTDWFIRASVNKVRVWSAGTVESLFSSGTGNSSSVFAETDVDSIITDGFIFSANSGITIWDWSGNRIEVIP